jgi:hypothetical protein
MFGDLRASKNAIIIGSPVVSSKVETLLLSPTSTRYSPTKIKKDSVSDDIEGESHYKALFHSKTEVDMKRKQGPSDYVLVDQFKRQIKDEKQPEDLLNLLD